MFGGVSFSLVSYVNREMSVVESVGHEVPADTGRLAVADPQHCGKPAILTSMEMAFHLRVSLFYM